MSAEQPQQGEPVEFEKSAEAMRQARDEFGRRAYEKLLQLSIEAGQGAFSPSRPAPGLEEQGQEAHDPSDDGGAD